MSSFVLQIVKNKQRLHFHYPALLDLIHIDVGRNEAGNAYILQQALRNPEGCFWFHQWNATSALTIMRTNNQPISDLVEASKWIKSSVYSRDADVMIGLVSDLKVGQYNGYSLLTPNRNWKRIFRHHSRSELTGLPS